MDNVALTQVIQFLKMYRDKGIWSFSIEDSIIKLINSINQLPSQERIKTFIDTIETV